MYINLNASTSTLFNCQSSDFAILKCLNLLQCDQSSQAKVGGADPRKKFIGKNSKTP